MPRLPIKDILRDPVRRRELLVRTIQSLQAMAGIQTSRSDAERAYDAAEATRKRMRLREQAKRSTEPHGRCANSAHCIENENDTNVPSCKQRGRGRKLT